MGSNWRASAGRSLFLILLIVCQLGQANATCPEELVKHSVKDRIPRFSFRAGDKYLVLEFLYDGLTRFETSAVKAMPREDESLYTSPMLARTDFPGPTHLQRDGNRFETPEQVITVDPSNLHLTIVDKVRGVGLTTLSPDNMKNEYKTLSIDPFQMTHVYGLGQYPTNPHVADGDWVGRVWEPGSHGNTTRFSEGGIPSLAQFPIMYALGKDGQNYALFLDVPYKQRWDFSRPNQWWKVDMWGDEIRGYVISGKDLPELRERYMDLTGRPPVPPKKVFGMWMSKFGYESWREVDDTLASLRNRHFPVEGFAMDLQWFGNNFNDPDNSRMGSLKWDEHRFPDAGQKIQDLRRQGIDLMLIEQSYVQKGIPEHDRMGSRGYLVRDDFGGSPTFINSNPWWGRGGLIDWSDPMAGVFWHDEKRMPLIASGINYHWTDLGEPEMFNPWGKYHGIAPNRHSHGDVHNVFNLMWLKSISDGYRRKNVRERFYTMSRSGTSGLQRFGAGMWSGDVGANMGYLRMHVNNHLHMAFSGIDYYSSDTGGFFRWSLDGNLHELYTQWFAMAAMIDSPLRPHTWNLSGVDGNNPTDIGHSDSNFENLKQRYELAPYYYTLAHRANQKGEPVFPPMVHYYQWDPNVRSMGNQMMIGRDLVMGIAAKYGETDRNLYLPKGRWFDYHSNELFTSDGQFLNNVPLYRYGKFKLPLYARSGAILPKAKVDAKTMNILGQRTDGTRLDDLVVRVYADSAESNFDLIEDDGVSIAYQENEIRTTNLWQKIDGETARLVVRGARGTFKGAPNHRAVTMEMVVADKKAKGVKVAGNDVPEVFSQQAFEAYNGACYWNVGRNILLAKSESRNVYDETVFEVSLDASPAKGSLYFVCRDGLTQSGESIYVSGNIPELGNWDPAKAVKLSANPYPTWTGIVEGVALNTTVEWRFFKRREDGGDVLKWEDSPNHKSYTESVYPIKGEGRMN